MGNSARDPGSRHDPARSELVAGASGPTPGLGHVGNPGTRSGTRSALGPSSRGESAAPPRPTPSCRRPLITVAENGDYLASDIDT